MDFDFGGLLEVLIPALAGILAVVFAFLWRSARKLVQETENKWDDAVWDAFDKGYESAKAEEAEKE